MSRLPSHGSHGPSITGATISGPVTMLAAISLAAISLGGCADDPPLSVHELEPDPQLAEPRPGAALPGLVINEVMTRNQSTVMAPDPAPDSDGFPDWLELYNAGSTAVDMSTVILRDRGGNLWRGMPGELAPGQHLLLYADGVDAPGHAPFRLAGEGEELILTIDNRVLDRIATGQMDRDTSWARFPDGGDFAVTIRPTPGWTNGIRPSASLDPTDGLFQRERITEVHLTVPSPSWASLEVEPRVQVPASMAFQGAYFADVGARLKGRAGSRRSLDEKCAWKVDLNDHVPGQGLRGLNSLTFNNMVQDPSYVHEYLAYTIFRAVGIPAPRVGWTRLHVNGVYFGLYLFIESVDDEFLERWYRDPAGHLFEGAYGTDFEADEVWQFEYDEGPDENDRSDLLEVAYILDGEPTNAAIQALRQHVDLDQFILSMAVEALILHWDGYTTSNNYRVYHDPATDLFQIIPWGTDQTFVDYWFDPYEGNGRVFTFCMANLACRAQYGDALRHVADTVESLDLEPVVEELEELLWVDISSDPRREHSLSYILSHLQETKVTLRNWPAQVRAQIEP